MRFLLIAVLFIVASSIAISGQSMFDKVNDFDGDGRADFVVTRDENGLKVWHIWRSSAGYLSMQWGLANDEVAAGDYDGDGRTDLAVARHTGSVGNQRIFTTYYFPLATGTFSVAEVAAMNIAGLTSVSNEDYDGDGRTDPGVYQWHGVGFVTYRTSSDGVTSATSSMDFQVRTGDITGNSAAEIVSHTPSTGSTTVRNVAEGGQFTFRFGVSGDIWVAADFDGDNKGDVAIFRPSSGDWWWIRSSDSVVNVAHWGASGDSPVPADYDGDGRSDLAIWRPASPQSAYWVFGSTAGPSVFGFGVPTDKVVKY